MDDERIYRSYFLSDRTRYRIDVICMVSNMMPSEVVDDAIEVYGAFIEERQRIKKKALKGAIWRQNVCIKKPRLIKIPIE